MGKIKSVLKIIIFIWGLLSLLFVVLFSIWIALQLLGERQAGETSESAAYEKRFDQIVLRVQDSSDEIHSAQLISIIKANKPLVSNYRLPVEQYGMEHPAQIRDSLLIPTKDNEYRVVLFTTYYECAEDSTDYVWFFKLSDKLNLISVVDLAEVTRTEDSILTFFGYKHVKLPSFENADYRHFIIPLMVAVNDSIHISPLLNKSGIDLLKAAYEAEAEKRMATLTNKQDAEMLDKYKTALNRFRDAITEKRIDF